MKRLNEFGKDGITVNNVGPGITARLNVSSALWN